MGTRGRFERFPATRERPEAVAPELPGRVAYAPLATVDVTASPAGAPVIGPVARRGGAPSPHLVMRGLDGTHMGIGVNLWRAAVLDDPQLRDLILDRFSRVEILHSTSEVLIGMLMLAEEAHYEETAGDADDAHGMTRGAYRALAASLGEAAVLSPTQRRYLRDIAQAMMEGDVSEGVFVALISPEEAVDVVAQTGRWIADRWGFEVEQQWNSHLVHIAETMLAHEVGDSDT